MNGFSTEIEVTVSYSDGKAFTHIWPTCSVVHIGASQPAAFGTRATGVSVEQKTVKTENRIVHSFNESDISELHEKAELLNQNPIWIIEPAGVSFSNNDECLPSQ